MATSFTPTEDGRSGADAPSGCQPTASAAVPASSQSGIPNAVPFTRGPWAVDGDGIFRQWHNTDRQRVATVYNAGFGHNNEFDANAHLIAAAPELYEALELFARLELPTKPVGNAGMYSIPFERIERAKAALAKARGES